MKYSCQIILNNCVNKLVLKEDRLLILFLFEGLDLHIV